MKSVFHIVAALPLLFVARPALATITWTQVSGYATTTQGSIASTGVDTWIVGTTSWNSDGNQVYEFNSQTQQFEGKSAGAIQLSLPSDQVLMSGVSPWAITKSGVAGQGPVKKWNGATFVAPNGQYSCARSLAAGPVSGSAAYVWIVGCDPPNSYGDAPMYRYSDSTGWVSVNPGAVNGYGSQIAVDAAGTPWVMNSVGSVYNGPLDGNGFPVWSFAGPGGGVYVAGQYQFGVGGGTATLLGWDRHVYEWVGSGGWFDVGTGQSDFVQITGYAYGYWAIDSSSRIWSGS